MYAGDREREGEKERVRRRVEEWSIWQESCFHNACAFLVEGITRPELIKEVEKIEKVIRNRLPIGSSIAYAGLIRELIHSKVCIERWDVLFSPICWMRSFSRSNGDAFVCRDLLNMLLSVVSTSWWHKRNYYFVINAKRLFDNPSELKLVPALSLDIMMIIQFVSK